MHSFTLAYRPRVQEPNMARDSGFRGGSRDPAILALAAVCFTRAAEFREIWYGPEGVAEFSLTRRRQAFFVRRNKLAQRSSFL